MMTDISFQLQLPKGWREIEPPAHTALVAFPADDSHCFRPSIVITGMPLPAGQGDDRVDVYMSAVIAELEDNLDHFEMHHVWISDNHSTGQPTQQRLIGTHRSGGQLVDLIQHHVWGVDRSLVVTASVDTHADDDLVATMNACLDSVRFAEAQTAVTRVE